MAPPRKYLPQQVEMMLDCLEENKDMVHSALVSGHTNLQVLKEKWKVLAKRLNAVPGGPTKTTDAWRKFWIEWRYKCKKKVVNMERLQSSNNPHRFYPLDELELRALELTGIVTTTEGDQGERVDFDADSNSANDTKNVPPVNIANIPNVPIKPKSDANSSDFLSESNDGHTEAQPSGGEAWSWPSLVVGGAEQTSTPMESGRIRRKRKSTVSATEDDITSPPPPKWALELERRRIEAEERMADAMQSIAAVMRMQEERQTMTDERIADSLTAIAGTVQDMSTTLTEALQHLYRLRPPPGLSNGID